MNGHRTEAVRHAQARFAERIEVVGRGADRVALLDGEPVGGATFSGITWKVWAVGELPGPANFEAEILAEPEPDDETDIIIVGFVAEHLAQIGWR